MSRSERRRKLLRAAMWVAGALAAAVAALVAYVQLAPPPRYPVSALRREPISSTPARIARGRVIFRIRCVDCHVDPTTGLAAGRRMSDIPEALGISYSANITSHAVAGIGGWTDGELAYALRTGVSRDGRLLPPWMPRLMRMSDEDLNSLIAFLRSDDPMLRASAVSSPGTQWSFAGRALSLFAWRPEAAPRAPITAPRVADRVAYGRYVVRALAACWTCHSGEFQRLDRAHPERTEGYLAGGTPLRDAAGDLVPSANITPDVETGIGAWSVEDLERALRDGVRPDGRRLRYPMPRYDELEDAEIAAIHAYLQTVPPIRKRVEVPPVESSADPSGRALYEKYGCRSCHGDDGVGIADLRQVDEHFASDAELEAWIRHPSRIRPGSRMPDFDGVIREDELPVLMRYVRSLAARAE